MKMGVEIGWSGYYIYDQLSCFLYSLVLLAWEHTVRGGATLEPGCAAAHPDFLKNQRKFFFLYR